MIYHRIQPLERHLYQLPWYRGDGRGLETSPAPVAMVQRRWAWLGAANKTVNMELVDTHSVEYIVLYAI